MPKVAKKTSRSDELLQPVTVAAMDTSEPPTNDAAPSDAPKFAPLSAFEQNGARVEFRRVCATSTHANKCSTCNNRYRSRSIA